MARKKKIEVVTVPELTAEQEQLLRERFQREDQVQATAAGEWVRTNVTTERQFIPDLGIKAGEAFYAEHLAPGEVKDLAQKYRIRELKASKFLQIQTDNGNLAKGHVNVERKIDPFKSHAMLNPTGTVRDPLSGQRPYDLKLKELRDKELEQDMETRLEGGGAGPQIVLR